MAIGPSPPDVVVALDNDVLNDWRFRKPTTLAAISNYISLLKAPPALTSVTIFEMMHGFEKAELQAGVVNERLRRDRVTGKNTLPRRQLIASKSLRQLIASKSETGREPQV